jgi:rifampicin phosphotransferase
MTPLFQDWLLERIEEGYVLGMRKTTGTAIPFRHAAVNGWYYTATPRFPPLTLLRTVVQSRGKILPFILNVLIRVGSKPEVADRAVLRRLMEEWRQELLPGYRGLVEEGERAVQTATPEALTHLVNEVSHLAGDYLWSLAVVGGSAWKMEGCLARFFRQHLATRVEGSIQLLLRGLPGTDPEVPSHAVQSVDWYRPTAGELGWERTEVSPDDRRRHVATERQTAEAACRAALAGEPELLARFEILLAVAQRYAAVREEQARWFTLGWPLLRRCALRLGEGRRVAGAIDREEDVFFLTRAELQGPAGPLEAVSRRRAEWERQRRLIAPLTIGEPPKLIEHVVSGAVDAVRTGSRPPEGAIIGHPASPGRAVGPVRIVRGVEDFDRFQPGEVLVAQATAPAWTSVFARAVAVVTDGGTLAAHASLVTREYGIPAVVGTGDATARLRDGQVVVVDGSGGAVLPGE